MLPSIGVKCLSYPASVSDSNFASIISFITSVIAHLNTKPSPPSFKGETLCHVASWLGRHTALRLLQRLGADVNAKDDTGSIPVFDACWKNHGKTVEALVDMGANLKAVGEDGYTAIMWASTKGNIEIVQFLHKCKAELDMCGQSGTAMHAAALGGHVEMLEVIYN